MTILSEGRHGPEFLLSELPGTQSRDVITIESGAGVVKAGTVVGKKSVASATSAAKSGGNTGDGTFVLDVSTPVRSGAKVGIYKLRVISVPATHGSVWSLQDPDGFVIENAVVAGSGGTKTIDNDIKGVITDGGTDFIVGDGFDITVTAGSTKWVPAPDSAVTGAQVGAAVTLYEVDATSADQKVAAITRGAEVNGNILTYEATVDDTTKKGTKATQLALVGILVR